MRLLSCVAALSAFVLAAPALAASDDATPVAANAPGGDPVDQSDPAEIMRVLSDADADRYRRIFDLQEDANWKAADKIIGELDDKILMGYVLYQRYMHPTGWRSAYSELKKWMAYYADLPNASDIYRLALKRRPRHETPPVRPVPRKWRDRGDDYDANPLLEADLKRTSAPRVRQIENRVRYLCAHERATTALGDIDREFARRVITERQYDRMRSWIAASLYYQGYVDTAEKVANEAAARNGDVAVLAHWIAGLIDFRKGRFDSAHAHFAAQAAVPYQEDSLRAAAAFWAARSALAGGDAADVTPELERAGKFPFTFYGQLALAQLGRDGEFDWTTPQVTPEGFAALVKHAPSVRRAVALAEAGQEVDADLELRWAAGSVSGDDDDQLLAVAAALDLPAAQVDIAEIGDAKHRAAGLYPIPRYEPASGFKADRALLYALMRQESKFKVEATSRVGARGLMQLMPGTASFVTRDRSLARGRGKNRLYDPAYNLDIGQTYVNHLITTAADGDLFDMAVAYNGGPGNLRRWKRDLSLDDPLLFIESIPSSESRNFVEKVLTNVWIYRARLGQPAPSRDQVAAGALPLYEALDRMGVKDAEDEIDADDSVASR
ncbi:MAG: transglycosylase SLT domain-containing protein [Alphaproteobacteria bacterium]|nr:transglycosylase SLT domain-containing protein [Alphaproteobacteria bacterium]